MPENIIHTVTEAVNSIRSSLERVFPFIWIRGEITELSHSSSGHIYFALKDGQSRLKCAWFSGKQKNAGLNYDPLTGEVFENPRPSPIEFLRNGLELICAGQITFFNAGGVCQLSVEFVEPVGAGALAIAFEQLKSKLSKAGYFNQEHKKKLPQSPFHIALITSPNGAAIHDFFKIASSRGLGSIIRLYPVPVQGIGAAEKIALAIELITSQKWADVIVIIRGGGSPEDLWTFNEEVISAAIFKTSIPVLTGIGHEIDISLADLTADVYAATPSQAAHILFTPRTEIAQKLDGLNEIMFNKVSQLIERNYIVWEKQNKLLKLLNPEAKLNIQAGRLKSLERDLYKNIHGLLINKTTILSSFITRLKANKNGLNTIQRFKDKIDWQIKRLDFAISKLIRNKIAELEKIDMQLENNVHRKFQNLYNQLENLCANLTSLNPELPLKRGYSLLYKDNKLLDSVSGCLPGQTLEAQMIDGKLIVSIESIQQLQ